MASVDIFIGAPIEHASERAVLARAAAFLSGQRIPAVILANVILGGRQIDLVIGLHQSTLVLESKALSSPVRGGVNGDWQVRLPSGRWKPIPNAYAQAWNEKLALRDAMAEFAGADVPYPDAAVVFVPAIPVASAIPPGDFKVSVVGIDDLPDRITSTQRRGWSLNQWRAFAAHHRLNSVPSIDAALSGELLDAERLLTDYANEFTRTYGPLASTMVPLSCVCDGETLSSEIVVEQAGRDRTAVLTGQSGCGKSLLSYAIALAALRHERVPIVVPAKDFEGSLREVANREMALLGAPSAIAVISAAHLLNRNLVLVVDGYNECTPSERQRLTRSVAAALWRYGANAVISSRIALERADLLPARTYTLPMPDLGTKRRIAQQIAGGASVEAFSDLLDSVGSGLEARMIGQLGQNLPAGTSKYGLFDAYVRERLGAAAFDGIRVLSQIARIMTERISFGLSVREVGRLFDREGVSGTALEALQGATILDTRGDRVSFSHEMFLNVFAAEAIIRRAGNNLDALLSALRLPQHLEMKPFVLGAIDDDSFRHRVLSDLSDPHLVRECLAGQCGHDALLWANTRCNDVLARIAREVETVRFEFSGKAPRSIRARPETLQNWTVQDRAVLAAIPHELVGGRRLDDVLNLIGKMDERLDEEHRRLLDEARKRKVALRSDLYYASYSGMAGREIGLSEISGPIYSGHLYDGPKVAASANLFGRLCSESLSPGQIGLLIELDKYSGHDAPSIGALLPGILKRLWRGSADRLRLGLMHAAGMSAHALSDDERRALIAVIEELMPANGGFDSTGMIDALKFLGALDDDQAEHVASVKGEINATLAERDNPLMWRAAAGLWSAQFDHPYDGAYCAAWSDLSSDDRKSLLLMAAQVAEGDSMFTPPLIAEVASYADPATGQVLARWTALPPKKQVIIGDVIGSFKTAYVALARLHCPLPDHSAKAASAADHALLACGAIVYWLHRDDLSRAERRHNCACPLAILLRHETGVAAAVVGEFLRSDLMFSESAKCLPGSEPAVTSFDQDFPEEMAAIYRAALEHPTRQTGYFEFFRVDDVIENALMTLGSLGNARDIPLLRAWSIHPSHGHSAVRAIKAIEEAPHRGSVQGDGG